MQGALFGNHLFGGHLDSPAPARDSGLMGWSQLLQPQPQQPQPQPQSVPRQLPRSASAKASTQRRAVVG